MPLKDCTVKVKFLAAGGKHKKKIDFRKGCKVTDVHI